MGAALHWREGIRHVVQKPEERFGIACYGLLRTQHEASSRSRADPAEGYLVSTSVNRCSFESYRRTRLPHPQGGCVQ